MESLSVRHGLLSLSKRGSERSEVDLYHYQMAISQLCTDINGIEPDKLDIQQVHRILAASLLLYVVSLPYSDGSWAQHIRGMISVVRLTDQSILASTKLGRFLLCMSSVPDIPTFSVGRDYSSQKAWVSWMLHRTSTGDGGELTCLETMLGYPESLLNIIARVAELGDDRFMQEALKEPRLGQSQGSCNQGLNDLSNGLEDELELSLRQWEMPMLLKGMSPMQKLALRTSWETFQKASLLYLWRRHGFRANILQPIRHDRQIQAKALVQDILVNVGAILEMGKDKRISIGNAMLWPLAV
ncbi:fungal-specific transcription factor domain-containing protein, partial [Colletotrichum asianum]